MPPRPPHRPDPSRTRRLLLAAACAAGAWVVVAFGRPVVGETTVSYLDRPMLPPRRIELPFQETAATAAVVFRIDAVVSRPPTASSLLRIAPDECIESVAVNGTEVRDFGGLAAEERCWPQKHTLDVGDALHPGDNMLRLVVTNKDGPHGVGVTPVLAPLHVFVASVFAWAALTAMFWPVLTHPAEARRLASSTARLVPLECLTERRFWCYAWFPLSMACAELLILGLMHYHHPSLWAMAAAHIAGRTLPLLLYVRLLDRAAGRPLRLRASYSLLALCLAWATLVILASTPVHHPWHISVHVAGGVYAARLAALLLAVAAVVPVRELAKRAAGRLGLTLLLLVSLLPFAEPWLSRPMWRAFHWVVAEAVTFLARLQGWPSWAGGYYDRRWGRADIVRTEMWELEVVRDCGDFKTVLYFVALFAAMLLSRPGRMACIAGVIAAFMIGVAGVIALNGWRMASLVVFASEMIEACGRSPAVYRDIARSHTDGGPWLLYSYVAYFGLYLRACARWLDRGPGRCRRDVSTRPRPD